MLREKKEEPMRLALTLALIVGLSGAAGVAQAGGYQVCKKTNTGAPCGEGGNEPGQVFNTAAEANAWAQAVATGVGVGVGQGGDGGNASSSATGGNAYNGGNKLSIKGGDVFNAPAPSASATGWCMTLPTGGICAPMKSQQISMRLDLIDRCQAKVGQGAFYVACIQSITRSTQIRKALIEAGLAK